jgi:uncharacterized membrane protein
VLSSSAVFNDLTGVQMEPSPTLDAKGFFQSLFDFKFTSLITTRIIRVVYVIVVVVFALAALALFFGGLGSGEESGIIFAIIFVPIGFLLYVIAARIWMELIIIVFRIGEDIRAIRTEGRGLAGGGAAGGGLPPLPPTLP